MPKRAPGRVLRAPEGPLPAEGTGAGGPWSDGAAGALQSPVVQRSDAMHQHARKLPSGLVLVALAGCGGGTEEPGVATLSFTDAGSTTTEGATGHLVAVELTVAGLSLAAPVTVDVADLGTGTATSGVDYTALPATTLTFPAGSLDGDTQTLPLATLGDSSVEGAEETIRLVLQDAVGAKLTGPPEHLVTITDANRAEIGFELAATTTTDETPRDYELTVEMLLDPGDSLDADVAVVAADSGTGDATSGEDYATFEPQVVTFPSGSPSGTTRTVTLSVQDDAAYELDESAVVSLTPSTGSVDLGTNADHTLTITDDDVSPDPFLAVGAGSGSPGSSFNSGHTLDLGTQTVGAGPAGSLSIHLNNLGAADMDVSVLNLSGDTGDFSIQTVAPLPPPAGEPAPVPFPLLAFDLTTDQGTALAPSPELLSELGQHDRVRLLEVPLPEGTTVDLLLERLPSPWRPHSVLAVNGAPVAGGPAAVLGELSLWRGTVAGFVESEAFLSFSAQGSAGWIRLSDDRDDLLHLVSEAPSQVGGLPEARLVRAPVMEAFAHEPAPQVCLGETLPPWGTDPEALLVPDAPPATESLPLTVAEAELVLETDYQFHQRFGGTAAATTYVTQLVAALSDRYAEDVQTTLAIAYLGLYDNAADPWSTPETPGADAGDMLAEFRGAWGTSWPVDGDLAHFLSGAPLGGGIAYVGVLCSSNFGYGVSANINGAIDWDTFDGSPNALNWDFVVVGHELGHNFGASHTHSYCPPLDTCYSNCSGGTSCGQGTMMSYCHLCAGGLSMITPEFHPHIATVMRSNVAASCLGQSSIEAGEAATFLISFEPTSAAGAKSAVLSFSHTATNQPSPFELNLSATSTP